MSDDPFSAQARARALVRSEAPPIVRAPQPVRAKMPVEASQRTSRGKIVGHSVVHWLIDRPIPYCARVSTCDASGCNADAERWSVVLLQGGAHVFSLCPAHAVELADATGARE